MSGLELALGASGAEDVLFNTGDSASTASGEQLGCASLISAATDYAMLDSEHSSAETLPMMLSGTGRCCSNVSDTAVDYGQIPLPGPVSQSDNTTCYPETAAVPSAPSTAQPVRKGQGYRRLWQAVSKVQRGQKLTETNAAREDVTVRLMTVLVGHGASINAAMAMSALHAVMSRVVLHSVGQSRWTLVQACGLGHVHATGLAHLSLYSH